MPLKLRKSANGTRSFDQPQMQVTRMVSLAGRSSRESSSAYLSIFTICWFIGTGSGLQFYFLVAACLVVLQLGVDRIFLASILAAIAGGFFWLGRKWPSGPGGGAHT